MSLEGNPVGNACNIKCEYCYEQSMRDAGNITTPLNMEKFLASLDSYNQPFTLFGGEPLLLALDKLEHIFKHGFQKWKQNGVQTNGILITDKHVELFKLYRVHVGFSIDGPWPINSIRCDEESTAKSIENLQICLAGGISTSLIITLSSRHCLHSDRFIDWLHSLDNLGLRSARLHFLEHDNGVEKVNQDSMISLLSKLEHIELGFQNLRFDLFSEIYQLLQNPEQTPTCVWGTCDAYTTNAVQGVGPSGERHNCGRTNKEGINWSKANKAGYERQIALYNTDCKGCRFFLACKGYCPGTAIDGDFRRKTEHCETLFALFNAAESRLRRARIKVYTDSPDLQNRELNFLKKLSCTDTKNGCGDKKVDLAEFDSNGHVDWHIDSNAKIQRTGNIPVGR